MDKIICLLRHVRYLFNALIGRCIATGFETIVVSDGDVWGTWGAKERDYIGNTRVIYKGK